MLVSRSHNFVFIHIPKTGGTSVTAALAPYLDDPKPVPVEDVRGWQLDFHVDRRMHGALRELEIDLGDFFVFSFVRNPWTRIASLYYAIRDNECNLRKAPGTVRDFKEFLRRRDPVYPQIYYQRDCGGNLGSGFVGRFERLQTDFDVVCSQIGIPCIELPRRNVRSKPMDARRLYDAEAIDMVREQFVEDVVRFGYEPPWAIEDE